MLDVISHRPDMPLAPGAHTVLGFGLWNSLPATLLVEGGFWLLAIILYVHGTRAKGRAGIYGFWIVIALLTWIWLGNITTPPPPSGIGSLVYFTLVIDWAYWMNRCRPSRSFGNQDQSWNALEMCAVVGNQRNGVAEGKGGNPEVVVRQNSPFGAKSRL